MRDTMTDISQQTTKEENLKKTARFFEPTINTSPITLDSTASQSRIVNKLLPELQVPKFQVHFFQLIKIASFSKQEIFIRKGTTTNQ